MLSCRQNYSNITFRSQKSKKYNKIDNNNNNINSKYYESTNENKSSTHNKVNNTPPTTSHWPQKKTVFILRDSMVKKLNSFLLTRKPNHNFFVRLDHLIRPRWDACTTILNQLFEILTRTTLYYIVGLMTRIQTGNPVRLLERLLIEVW